MKAVKALANSGLTMSLGSGDTGKGRVEHRGFWLLWFTHIKRNRSG